MDSIPPRTSLSGDGNSRPVSRASSTTTEVAGGLRPLLREIDHIKALISRVTISSKPAESSITAQVFRRMPQQNVTQAHIMHELDALRRRIKYETNKPALLAETEDVDPETETDEDDFHDAVDGYDHDYDVETVQDKLKRVSLQKEQIIEQVEARVDKVSDENDDLRHKLEAAQELIDRLQQGDEPRQDKEVIGHAHQQVDEKEIAVRPVEETTKPHVAAPDPLLYALEVQLAQARQAHDEEVDSLRLQHANAIEQSEKRIQQILHDADSTHRQQKSEHTRDLTELQRVHAEEQEAIHKKHIAELETVKTSNLEELSQANDTNRAAIVDLQAGHQTALRELNVQLTEALAAKDELDQRHNGSKQTCQGLQDQLQTLRQQLQERESTAAEDIKNFRLRCDERIEAHRQILEGECEARCRQLNDDHRTALEQALRDLDAGTHVDEFYTLEVLHEKLLAAQKQLRATHKTELDSIHSDRTRDVEELQAQLTASRKELDRFRQDYNDLRNLHANEVGGLLAQRSGDPGASSTTSGAETEQVPTSSVQEATHHNDASISNEVDQARHPEDSAQIASLMSTIEELRSTQAHLEGMLQEKTHQAIVNEQDLKALSDKHTRTEHTLKELQETVVEHQALANNEAAIVDSELGQLKKHIEEAQAERTSVQSDIDAKLSERAELARQNEFLTSQLATMSRQMEQPASRPKSYVNKSIQTAPRIQVLSPKSAGHRRNLSMPAANGSPSPLQSKRTSLVFGPELKADTPSSPLARQSRQTDSRPSTPLSPDYRPKRWSLQDYVERADAEADRLPSIITASEAFLAQKFREHLGDLQKSRDQLAREYQDRFDSLLADKQSSERQLMLEQATDFIKEREQLASIFLRVEKRELSAFGEKRELKKAEQALVRQYHERLSRRKSQIRLKHAEDFHNLTQDYDQRLQDLHHQQSEMEGGLFDEMSPGAKRLSTMSLGSVVAKNSGSEESLPVTVVETTSRLPRRNPKRSSSSSTSIPRMVSRSEIKDSSPAPQSKLSRMPSGEIRPHPPVRQRSLLRMRSPSTKRSITDLRVLDSVASSPTASEEPDDGYLGDAASFNSTGKGLKRQSGSPNFRSSIGMQRVSSSSSQLQQTVSDSDRSKSRAMHQQ